MAKKILTMCRQGLVRSVALANVLKLHYKPIEDGDEFVQPVEVLPCGYFNNSDETREMLYGWADVIVIMQDKYIKHIPERFHDRVMSCHVGEDTWGNPNNPHLIDKVWRWARTNLEGLGVREHNERI